MTERAATWRLYAAITGLAVLAFLALRDFAGDRRQALAAGPAGGSAPVDPLVANGPIFVDWPKPSLAIAFTGELDGYLEPCGCAGLENQLGGLKRRHSFFKQLEADGWPLVKLDLGGLVKRSGPQSEIKYRVAVESLAELGYQAIGLGPHDLRLGADPLAFALGNFPAGQSPIVAANVGVYGLAESVDMGMTRRYRVIEAGGKRIGVTAVLGARHASLAKNTSDIGYLPPIEALATVAPQLARERCDVQVLLVHGDPAEATALSKQFPQFQIVASAGGAEEPPKQPAIVAGSGAVLMEAGHKGMYVTVLAFFDDPDPAKRNRYQRVPLDTRFPESPAMQARLVAYQKELETMTLGGLGLTGVAHPDGEFAGSDACADCHSAAWAVFEKSPHYHATETLEQLDPPRQFDPECLSCHVTGWNPQEYFPYLTGYLSHEVTPLMERNGCENCHGPGAEHVKAENGETDVTDAQKESLRAALRMKIVANEGNKEGQEFASGTVVKNCMLCHDLDNSPDFDFQKYWPEVEHHGVD
ncbi:MAG TPA: multiheme c-type cytochrome [Lacipirellulaceae bacterium]|nr:multiheme c-type cytochrome [Lacipirellulaceae bacterium]